MEKTTNWNMEMAEILNFREVLNSENPITKLDK